MKKKKVKRKSDFTQRTLRTQRKLVIWRMEINVITSIIIEECIYIHRVLGPGLLESVYEEVLYSRLIKRGLFVERQKAIPVIFEDVKMEVGFRADLVVENKVIVELKSVEIVHPVHYKKLITYLKLSNLNVALMINFYEELLKKGIKRVVNNY
ncbi:MAG: GxxExxY protein [Chitinophagaceae bacterium]